jgi:surface antigen
MQNFIDTLVIIERHLKPSKSALECVYMAMELAPYFEKLAWLEANYPNEVKATILHDYQGLKSDDDYFVPRLA